MMNDLFTIATGSCLHTYPILSYQQQPQPYHFPGVYVPQFNQAAATAATRETNDPDNYGANRDMPPNADNQRVADGDANNAIGPDPAPAAPAAPGRRLFDIRLILKLCLIIYFLANDTSSNKFYAMIAFAVVFYSTRLDCSN